MPPGLILPETPEMQRQQARKALGIEQLDARVAQLTRMVESLVERVSKLEKKGRPRKEW